MKSLLIKDTTRAERARIVAEAIGSTEGACDGCAIGVTAMYDDYIEGRKELREVNREFSARYAPGRSPATAISKTKDNNSNSAE